MRTLDPCDSGHGIHLSSAGAVSVPCESTSVLSRDTTPVVLRSSVPCELSVVVLESVAISEAGYLSDDHVSLLRTPEPLSLARTTRDECEVTSATGRGIHLLPISKHLGNHSLGGAAGARTPLPRNKSNHCSRACGSSLSSDNDDDSDARRPAECNSPGGAA